MSRIDILKASLVKKEKALDEKFDHHFADVKRANGQPLNDKRNGPATMDRWEKQNNAIKRQIEEVQKTKDAIDREEWKIKETSSLYEKMPKYLTDLIDAGVLVQWRKHPRMMFVAGVEKARIVFNEDTGVISYRYLKEIPNQEQYAVFRDVYNDLNKKQKSVTG